MGTSIRPKKCAGTPSLKRANGAIILEMVSYPQLLLLLLDSRNDIQRTNKLVNGTKITISLNKLNNSDNLEDGKPSNTLFTYFVTSPEYFMHFEPQSPQYKKLKNGTITSLTLAITDQNNDIITDGLEVTVVLHI